MNKQIEFGSEARTQLMKGIDVLADAVVSTLGPNGRNVIYTSNGEVLSTKDGISVAKSIALKDPVQEMGVKLIRQAAAKTAEKAGDGTTTSTLLAREMVKNGLIHLSQGVNVTELKKGIDQAVNEVVDTLRNQVSEDISSENQLEQIATISANNDEDTGKLIATAINKVGIEGIVHIEESKTGETYLETVEGIQFDRGYKSPYFVTDNNSMTAVLDNPLILLYDGKLTQAKELVPILNDVSQQGRSLLIISEDMDGEALATLIVNKMRGTIRVCAVKAPDFGDRRKLIMEDIAITTGGVVMSKEKGMSLDKFSREWFGEARTITVGKEETTIVDGKGDEEKINQRIEELQKQIDKSQSAFEKEKLQERLAKMVGGVAVIHVGGNTEAEMREKKDRVEDALHATKAAIEEGIVPGGGVALLFAREGITYTKSNQPGINIGKQIVYKACGKPFYQILMNAGLDEKDIYPISAEIGRLGEIGTKPRFGYNINTETIVDMIEVGIADPTKVSRLSLQSAASVAQTILLTEVIVADLPEENKSEGMDPMMGMM